MRVLVCGGREFDDWVLLSSTIHAELDKRGLVNQDIFDLHSPPITVIQGGAKGADFLGRVWAKMWGFPYEEYPADWKTYGKSAGHIRNQQMLDAGKPDIVLAFPGGTGTADMVRKAKKAGVEVIEV